MRTASFLRLTILARLLLVLGLSTVLGASTSEAAKLETRVLKGQNYYTARSIKDFYNLSQMRVSGSHLILENEEILLKFSIGGQTAFMNGVKFIFSFPVQRVGDQILISQIDLVKLIDPILRPAYIPSAGDFKTVILDPGHGGRDSGAPSRYGHEAQFTLRTCLYLKKILESGGYKVVMTRQRDTSLELSDRVAIANRYDNAIFISLHFNSGGGRSAHGVETFTLSPQGVAHYGRGKREKDNQARTGNAQDSANIALATAVHHLVVGDTKSSDRGIKRARFSVLTGVKHPAILIEGGFLSNPEEAKRIASDSYQKTLAFSIAKAVRFYHVAVTRNRN